MCLLAAGTREVVSGHDSVAASWRRKEGTEHASRCLEDGANGLRRGHLFFFSAMYLSTTKTSGDFALSGAAIALT